MLNVADIMTVDVATCRTTDSLDRAAQLMWERSCSCLPVLDGNRRVVGIVTDWDVCMALTRGAIDDESIHDAARTDVADLVQNGWAALKTLRAEIRIDLQLASKQVRGRWRRLEARLRSAP